MALSSFITMHTAALDETPTKDIILRGVLDSESLKALLHDDYQREVLPITSKSKLLDAYKHRQHVPDIELGMRGSRFVEKNGVFTLQDRVYIIDGLQRVSAALRHMVTSPDIPVRLGATLYFNTSKDWKRERFRVLNTMRARVSPNIIIRNSRHESKSIGILYSLSNDKTFVLGERVAWQQRMLRGQLISALNLLKVTGMLHKHRARSAGHRGMQLMGALDSAIESIGVQAFRGNVVTFWNLIDEAWGIRRNHYREEAVHIRSNFLLALARVLSDHTDFWDTDDKKLFIDAPLRRKIASFHINDPAIERIAGGGGKSNRMLYGYLCDHINSGKRSKRLKSRFGTEAQNFDDVDTDIDDHRVAMVATQ